MPGPIQKQTENTVLSTELIENSQNKAERAPLPVSSNWERADGKQVKTNLFIENDGIENA